jgi:hypothetical protein
LRIIITLVSSKKNFVKFFFVNVTLRGKSLEQILCFCKLTFPLPMLMFMLKLCKLTTMNPIEETKKRQFFSSANKQKIYELVKKVKNLN